MKRRYNVYAYGTTAQVTCVPTVPWDVYVFDDGVTVKARGRRAIVSSRHGDSPAWYAHQVARILGHGLEWKGGFWESAGTITDEEAQS